MFCNYSIKSFPSLSTPDSSAGDSISKSMGYHLESSAILWSLGAAQGDFLGGFARAAIGSFGFGSGFVRSCSCSFGTFVIAADIDSVKSLDLGCLEYVLHECDIAVGQGSFASLRAEDCSQYQPSALLLLILQCLLGSSGRFSEYFEGHRLATAA
jgi:hypothetical protein